MFEREIPNHTSLWSVEHPAKKLILHFRSLHHALYWFAAPPLNLVGGYQLVVTVTISTSATSIFYRQFSKLIC
ncbi:hypothetical protein AMATHDRAFT_68339 [Amanita thiersii Skay4041]|uniref:Uncharacterized protein n=1 Tax=Amanita thiersii Skay4041 TaxID=703135 RepID=A0A2A9NH98_9AGAR|nr:hypothetical protein AMATHDRAFT_68339 [Amanita thiersii Skay4041]